MKIYHPKYDDVLKQGNHGKISWCFETGKPWYTIHLPYTIYKKAWSTTVYHVMLWCVVVYHVIPCNMVYHVIPWYVFIRDMTWLNRTGPRTDPCGTPNGRCCGQDSVPDMLMFWLCQKCHNVYEGVVKGLNDHSYWKQLRDLVKLLLLPCYCPCCQLYNSVS